MNKAGSKPVLIVVLVLVIVGAAAYLFFGPGRDAFREVQRAPAEKIELTPTPEHPSAPGLAGGGN